MKRLSGTIVLLALTGCASGGSSGSSAARPDREHVIVSAGDGAQMMDVTIQRDDGTRTVIVDAPRDAVWRALPAVYQELGLPAPAADESTWTVAVQNHQLMRRVGRVSMSRIVACGRGMTGENADTHRIRLSVQTWLTPVDQSTEVSTRVQAVAAPVEGRAGSITCTSRGALEEGILKELRSRTGGD